MATLGMRHAVLWVRDPAASARFYAQALGREAKVELDHAIFMSSPATDTDHDLGLFRTTEAPAAERGVGLYHIAWEVGTLAELVEAKERLMAMDAYVGENDHGISKSLYCKDPDGIEFEVMWEVPFDLIDPDAPSGRPLDLEGDIARWGANRPGRGLASRAG